MARRKGRSVDGILLLDKPAGLTSNKALRQVSRWLDARKAGHTGSLDPLATGLLVLCFGEATKISGWLLDADKRYVATARLGVVTDSADADGEVLSERPVPAIDNHSLEPVLAGFRGAISQVPPMVSALKHEGRRLHELAREGKTVDRPPRPVTIHSLTGECLAPDRLQLTVDCSKGTYIRSLVADIGEALGCGAHVETLRRTALGPFPGDGMWNLETLEARREQGPDALDDLLLTSDQGLIDYPAVTLDVGQEAAFCQGQAATGSGGTQTPTELCRVYADTGVFLGIGVGDGEHGVAPRRLLVQRSPHG
ncbi:tRNA pseudouridine(55) synthase TruB [Spiribacter vilamensis]|uniref:tRNA pseudouridine synthase B n=1 Tax=Spiribacter vilamensis TaxID=531306 RepID=A0A4Q8D0R0_9GAMM|nr:tRNA pseudouridine(55) synthase TruB [Spiribacter vilamensis]RZU98852.1 tRNA pseudouridine synthase B [Spiribacter vilamensis]TVO62130.1 tRNA pseudouridine(55) synthase TruB [Spiribacter vilamensis]